MKWPKNKDFAFTIIDDTDNSTIENIKPVYDFLHSKNILTTKTVWVYEPRDHFLGNSLSNKKYLDFVKNLNEKGFEIQSHGVGSGFFTSEEIIIGYNVFYKKLNSYPSLHINHASNPDCIYWGHKRFGFILKNILNVTYGKKRKFYGDEKNSVHFWGDFCKKHIKYIRNRVFLGINTLNYDKKMPYTEKDKNYSNYWFSSSDGHTINEFNKLVSPKNIDLLKKERGLCIVYTHFASGFVKQNGELNDEFASNIDYLSKQNGWFVPASEILDFLLKNKKNHKINTFYRILLDFRWIYDRIMKKIRYKK